MKFSQIPKNLKNKFFATVVIAISCIFSIVAITYAWFVISNSPTASVLGITMRGPAGETFGLSEDLVDPSFEDSINKTIQSPVFANAVVEGGALKGWQYRTPQGIADYGEGSPAYSKKYLLRLIDENFDEENPLAHTFSAFNCTAEIAQNGDAEDDFTDNVCFLIVIESIGGSATNEVMFMRSGDEVILSTEHLSLQTDGSKSSLDIIINFYVWYDASSNDQIKDQSFTLNITFNFESVEEI